MTRILQGLRVLDFGQGVAGPYCGQLLGDHGADVIKVEPPRGDWSRTMGRQEGSGLSGTYVSVNRNKRGLCLDLRKEISREACARLAEKADILVESFRPGVMSELGLGPEMLCKANPQLIYVSVTGFGHSGPNMNLPAGDSIMQAYGGLMSIVGEPEGRPLRVGNVVSDMLAGGNAFQGVLLALLKRQTTGRGSAVRVSLLDSILAFQAPPLTEFLMTGQTPARGNHHPLIAPSGTFRTADGFISFTVLDHQWQRFCEGLELQELSRHEFFDRNGARLKNREDLNTRLQEVFGRLPSAEWIRKLAEIDILCAPINEYPQLLHDEQVRHNQVFTAMPGPDGSAIPMVRNPVRLDSNLGGAYRQPPRLGEHTREILQQELRWTKSAVSLMLESAAAYAAS